MTIRDLKEILSEFDNDMEITFEVDGVLSLRVWHISKYNNNCLITLGIKESEVKHD